MKPPTLHPHQETISGLLQLIGYLTDNPSLPVPADVEVRWSVSGTDAQRVAMVREIGRWLDVEPVWDEAGQSVWTYWRFPGVSWTVAAQLQQPAAVPEPAVVDVGQAVPEVECPACVGTGIEGTEREGGTCPYCLGKGRLAAPWLPAAEAEASAW